MNAPTTAAMYAPAMGISAVKPTMTEIVNALLKPKTIMPMKHNAPRISASVHWPTMKEWKESSSTRST